MGYTTTFTGYLEIGGKMTREFVKYINRFSYTRRMKRDNEKIKEIYPNWKQLCFNGELGKDGEYLAIQSNVFGQEKDDSILDYNRQAETQPGLWCQWVIETNEDMSDESIQEFTGKLKWDGSEKFYYYTAWLRYMFENFFEPSGFILNGAFLAVGEEYKDASYIVVDNNKIEVFDAMDSASNLALPIRYKNNDIVVKILNEIKETPDEIINNYWDWYEEYEDEYDNDDCNKNESDNEADDEDDIQLSDISDTDLIEELKNRGYVIGKSL